MASPPTGRVDKVECQPTGSYPIYDDYEDNASVAPKAQYGDPYNSTYTGISPLLANECTYNTPLPSNVWPFAMAAAAPGIPVADPMSSPIAPMHYMPIPLPSPFIGASTMTPNELQMQTDPLAHTSPSTPWWHVSQCEAGNSNFLTTPATGLEAATWNFQDLKAAGTFVGDLTADLSQLGILPVLPPDSMPRRMSMQVPYATRALTELESSASRPVTSAGNLTPSQFPTKPVSDITSPKPGAANTTSPRRPPSSRRASSSNNTLSNPQSLSPTAHPEKRARNRTAANQSRAKGKVAQSVLEASERAESQRHEQLLATFRALQSDVLALKSEILQHASCGDVLIQNYLAAGTAMSLVGDGDGSTAEGALGDGWLAPDWTDMQAWKSWWEGP